MKKIVYRGKIVKYCNEGEDDLVALQDADYPLAEDIADDIERHGRYLTARYYIHDSKEEISKDDLPEAFLKSIYGAANACYMARYSEITGYLWTDEEINIGGHSLLEELRSHFGKWLYLEIEYNQDGKPATKPVDSNQ